MLVINAKQIAHVVKRIVRTNEDLGIELSDLKVTMKAGFVLQGLTPTANDVDIVVSQSTFNKLKEKYGDYIVNRTKFIYGAETKEKIPKIMTRFSGVPTTIWVDETKPLFDVLEGCHVMTTPDLIALKRSIGREKDNAFCDQIMSKLTNT